MAYQATILNDSDILIGIFWTRLGSPTGEFASGTVEEISEHCNKNKLASIYISKRSYPDNIDLQQLQLLRDQTQIWLNEGLLEFYDDHFAFKQKIKDHLTLHIQENEYIKNILKKNYSDQNATKQTPIELTNEMKLLLLHAGQSGDDIQIQESIDCPQLHVGDLHINFENARQKSTWLTAVKELEKLALIVDTYDGILFELSLAGWQAFDQLKSQIKENS